MKINISKWIEKEINATEMQLLKAEDALAEAQYRVRAFRSRLARLKGRQAKQVQVSGVKPSIVIHHDTTFPPQHVGETTQQYVERCRAEFRTETNKGIGDSFIDRWLRYTRKRMS